MSLLSFVVLIVRIQFVWQFSSVLLQVSVVLLESVVRLFVYVFVVGLVEGLYRFWLIVAGFIKPLLEGYLRLFCWLFVRVVYAGFVLVLLLTHHVVVLLCDE